MVGYFKNYFKRRHIYLVLGIAVANLSWLFRTRKKPGLLTQIGGLRDNNQGINPVSFLGKRKSRYY